MKAAAAAQKLVEARLKAKAWMMKYYRLNRTRIQHHRRQVGGSIARFQRVTAHVSHVGAKRCAIQCVALCACRGARSLAKWPWGVGGVEYTVSDLIHAVWEVSFEGIGAWKTFGTRQSMDATHRAVQSVVHEVPYCGQGGKRRRLKDGDSEALEVFPRPSEHIMVFARRAVSLLRYQENKKVSALAKAIHLASDDKTFGNFHAKGTVVYHPVRRS